MIIVSGDNQRVAEAVVKKVGTDEAWGELLPEAKVDAIKEPREREKQVATASTTRPRWQTPPSG